MNKIAYFDNAATTFPKPSAMHDFMSNFYRENGASPGRGQYSLAIKGAELTEETRNLIKDIFHCSNKEVIFTHTATEALNLIIMGLKYEPDENIYITPFEHNAIVRVLEVLKKEHKFKIIKLPFDKEAKAYDLEEIRKLFSSNPPHKLFMTHISNAFGVITPIEEICKLAKEFKAVTLIDMCQSAGLIPITLTSNIYDFAVFDGHKTLYGPFGIAGIITSFKDYLLPPLIYGGTGIESANLEMPTSSPIRYEAGSHNTLAIAGLNAALKWLKNITIETMYLKDQEHKHRLYELLKNFEFIEMYVDYTKDNTVGIISCNVEGYASDSMGHVLDKQNVAVRTGLQCAPLAHEFMGTMPAGTIRFSVGHFNTDEDFDILEEALTYIEENR